MLNNMTLNEEKYLKQYIKNYIIESLHELISEEREILDEKEKKDMSQRVTDLKNKFLKQMKSDYLKRKSNKKGKSTDSKSKGSKENMKNKRAYVVKKLKNPGVNKAEYMRKLWKPTKDKEASDRSFFYKCVDGKKNDSGVPYQFSDNDVNRLYQYLTSE